MTNTTAPQPYDISMEAYREYVFTDGHIFRVDNPASLFIVNGSHRVVDKDGVCHRPERGYAGIRWMQTDGQAFTF